MFQPKLLKMEVFIDKQDMTPQEYDQKISLTNRQLAMSQSQDEKMKLNKRIKKLRLQKEIAVIKLKIQQLS